MMTKIYLDKSGLLSKDSCVLTIIELAKDFDLKVDLDENKDINPLNYNYICLPFVKIQSDLSIEKRLDFEYASEYLDENNKHLTEKWLEESENNKFTTYFNNFINKYNSLFNTLRNITDLAEYTKYKTEIEFYKKTHEQLHKQFIVKKEIVAIYNAIQLTIYNYENSVKTGDDPQTVALNTIEGVNTLIKRHNKCMFYFHKLSQKQKPFIELSLIQNENNILEMSSENILYNENKRKVEEYEKQYNTALVNYNKQIDILNEDLKDLEVDSKKALAIQKNIKEYTEKINALNNEKYKIVRESNSNDLKLAKEFSEKTVLEKVSLFMEDPKRFNEEIYLKIGYYFSKMPSYIQNKKREEVILNEIESISKEKYNTIVIDKINNDILTKNISELDENYRSKLQKLTLELEKLKQSIPLIKTPDAMEIITYARKNNININDIVYISH